MLPYNGVLTTPQISVTITCGIEPTGVDTKAMLVLHNSRNRYTYDLPDIYAHKHTYTVWRKIDGGKF